MQEMVQNTTPLSCVLHIPLVCCSRPNYLMDVLAMYVTAVKPLQMHLCTATQVWLYLLLFFFLSHRISLSHAKPIPPTNTSFLTNQGNNLQKGKPQEGTRRLFPYPVQKSLLGDAGIALFPQQLILGTKSIHSRGSYYLLLVQIIS